MRDQTDLRWCGLALHLGRHAQPLLTLEPDAQWAGLFRIRFRDGQLSDMANLSRARDAAEVIALSELNKGKGGNGRTDPPPMRLPRQGLSDQGPDLFERVLDEVAS